MIIGCSSEADCGSQGAYLECRTMNDLERLEWIYVLDCMGLNKDIEEPTIVIYNKVEGLSDDNFIHMPSWLVGEDEYWELLRHEFTHHICKCGHDSHWFTEPECIVL